MGGGCDGAAIIISMSVDLGAASFRRLQWSFQFCPLALFCVVGVQSPSLRPVWRPTFDCEEQKERKAWWQKGAKGRGFCLSFVPFVPIFCAFPPIFLCCGIWLFDCTMYDAALSTSYHPASSHFVLICSMIRLLTVLLSRCGCYVLCAVLEGSAPSQSAPE